VLILLGQKPSLLKVTSRVHSDCLLIVNLLFPTHPSPLQGDAGVRGNEEANNLAEQAPIDGVLCPDREDILKMVIDKFKEAENEDNNNNMYIKRMREMGMRVKTGKVSLKEKLKEFTIS
jgi:hypothetical protein